MSYGVWVTVCCTPRWCVCLLQMEAVPDDVHAPGRAGYVHSGDFIPHEEVLAADGAGGPDRAQGGMRTRVIHYFDRQKHT